MNIQRPALLLLTLSACLGIGPRAAEACSPQIPWLEATQPTQDAVVPTNSVLAFAWRGGRSQYSARLTVDGSTTAVDLGIVPEPLWSSAEVPTVALPEGRPGARATLELTPISSPDEVRTLRFTYGDGADTTPPPAPAAPAVLREDWVAADNPCAFPTDETGESVYVELPAWSDDDVALYALFSRKIGAGDDAPLVVDYVLRSDTGRSRLYAGVFFEPVDVCTHARTMDLAGNWSDPSLETCSTVNSGCTSVEGSAPSLGALALGLLLSAVRRRRAR